MPIPSFQDMMLPMLRFLSDGKEHDRNQIADFIADHFKLDVQDREEILPSGNQTRLDNRVGWCRTHLKNAGLIEYVRRGIFRITEDGQKMLAQNPSELNLKVLDQIPQHYNWFHQSKAEPEQPIDAQMSNGTPEEQIEILASDLKKKLATELLDRVKTMNPYRFQRLVLNLLWAMGYGGSRIDAITETPKSNDEGVDGWINQDKLGLDRVYIQAKRWSETPISRPTVQEFVGALAGKRSPKGIFITASDFSSHAREYAKTQPVILINGAKLAELMIEHNIAVSKAHIFEIKRIDSDYFEETEL